MHFWLLLTTSFDLKDKKWRLWGRLSMASMQRWRCACFALNRSAHIWWVFTILYLNFIDSLNNSFYVFWNINCIGILQFHVWCICGPKGGGYFKVQEGQTQSSSKPAHLAGWSSWLQRNYRCDAGSWCTWYNLRWLLCALPKGQCLHR